MYCAKCGKKISKLDSFCAGCGTLIKKEKLMNNRSPKIKKSTTNEHSEDEAIIKIIKGVGMGLVGYLLVTFFGGLGGIMVAIAITLGYRWFNNQEW